MGNDAAETSKEELLSILRAQRSAYLREGVPSAEVRQNRIDRLLYAMLSSADELADALAKDFGQRPRNLTFQTDVFAVFEALQNTRENLVEWMKDEPLDHKNAEFVPAFVEKKPKGVVGVIGPWNFPVTLVVDPAVNALAAGNRVMMKFTDMAPNAGRVLAEAVGRHLSPEEAVVINGGIETARAFSELPFDHIFFTGSPAVGRAVQGAAANNLVPVTLELGGKNPAVVGRDADLADAADRVGGARMLHSGQVCLCPDYVFVQEREKDAFVDALTASLAASHRDYFTNPGVTSLINDRNYQRVVGLIDDAVERGAKRIIALADDSVAVDAASRKVAPTILLDVPDDARIDAEEIFGPVIVVKTYDDFGEVIDYLNEHPHPLASFYFGSDDAEFERFHRSTTSGGLTRNDMAMHAFLETGPFGGIGNSGMGNAHGKYGFDTFSHQRVIATSKLPVGGATAFMPDALNAEQTTEALEATIDGAVAMLAERIGA
jgi:coniferyl-aldehyde dehydrogenase